MARRPEGWKLRADRRTGIRYVRFTLHGRRREVTTGCRDPLEATKEAQRIYAEAVSGRRQVAHGSGNLEVLCSNWLGDVEAALDPTTLREYELYVRTHWLGFFGGLEHMTEAGTQDYTRTRLRSVARKTVLKELSAMRGFLGWCVEQGHLGAAPVVQSIPRTVTGTPKIRREAIIMQPKDVERLLRALPEWAEPGRGRVERRYPIRARFEFAWETGMRPETIDALRVPGNYRKGEKYLRLADAEDKGRYGRPLPLKPRARRALDRVCPEVGVIFGAHDYRAILRSKAHALKLPHAEKITEQCFRHSRITHWTERAGDNLPGIQYLAGHKHLSTTAKYAKASLHAAEDVLKRMK